MSPRDGGRTLGAGMAAAAQAGSGERRPELDPGLAGQQDSARPGVDNGFAAGYRVRFDEAGADGLMRTSSLLRYAQDIAWRHSEDLGFDRSWYTERGRWWVVRSVELEVLAPVAMGRTLRVATAVIGHRRIWARRRGEFRLADGTLAAVASTDWVIVDERGRILRIPGDFGAAFPNVELEGDIIRVAPPPPPPDATQPRPARPAPGPRSDGPRQQRRLPRLDRGGRPRGRRPGGGDGHPAARRDRIRGLGRAGRHRSMPSPGRPTAAGGSA